MQIIDSLPNDLGGKRVTCSYVNSTESIQIARITNVESWYFERVVFPGQRLMFEAIADATLEIHTGMMASAILDDTYLCKDLALDSENVTTLVAAAPIRRAS
ncbi:MAG: DUF1830 domain-containing protein [Cyanobacteria bacterium J06639_1]